MVAEYDGESLISGCAKRSCPVKSKEFYGSMFPYQMNCVCNVNDGAKVTFHRNNMSWDARACSAPPSSAAALAECQATVTSNTTVIWNAAESKCDCPTNTLNYLYQEYPAIEACRKNEMSANPTCTSTWTDTNNCTELNWMTCESNYVETPSQEKIDATALAKNQTQKWYGECMAY